MALLAVANALSPGARASSPRVLSSLDHLREAIGRYARADPRLFAPDTVGRSGGRWIHPALRVPHYGHDESGAIVSTSLFGAPSRMVIELFASGELAIAPLDAAGSPDIMLPSELAEASSGLQGVAGSAGAAFVVAGAQRYTDMLIRALPFGVSVYVLFSSASAPERITFDTVLSCPMLGFQLDRRLAPGTFSFEEEENGEAAEDDECELYSHSSVAPIRPPSPTDTTAAYRAESSLFVLADRQARRDHAIAGFAIRAYPAHDAAGRAVRTEMAWRAGGEQRGPVIRVHLKAGHARFPVLMRFDVVTQP